MVKFTSLAVTPDPCREGHTTPPLIHDQLTIDTVLSVHIKCEVILINTFIYKLV